MRTQIKNTLYYFYKYSKKPVTLFWSIYLIILMLFFILTSTPEGFIVFEGVASFPSLIFMIFFPIFMFKSVYPHVIKLGITRKAFSISISIYALALSILMTTLDYAYLKIVNFIIDTLEIENFVFTGLASGELPAQSYGNPLINLWLLSLTAFLLFTLIGAIFYRFGMTWGIIIIMIFPLSLFFRPIGEKIIDVARYLFIFDESYTPLSFLILIAMLTLGIWLVVRRSSIIDQITNKT